MPTIHWSETAPANSDNLGLGAQEIRSLKTDLRTGLDTEHVWPSTGGDAGVHRLGSARPYHAPGSQISSTATIGRLMVNSDDYSLWGDTGTSPVPLGHQNLMVNLNTSGVYQRSGVAGARTMNAIQYGIFTHNGLSARSNVQFGSAYSGVPAVFLMAQTAVIGNALARLTAVNASGFSGWVVDATTTNTPIATAINVYWMSIGTVASGVA